MKPIIPFVILIVTFFSFSCSNPITTDDTQAKIDTVLKTVAKMESEAMASRLEKANENDSSIQEDNQAEKINTYLVESLKSAFGDQYKEKIRGYSLDYSRFLPNDSKRKQVFIDNTGTKVIPIAWYCTFEDWDVYVWAVVTWGKGTYSADGGSRNYVKVRVVYNYCDFFPSETSAGLYGAGDYFLDEVNAYICDETNTANPTFIQNKNTCLAYAKAGLFPYDQSRNVTSAWISMKDNGFNSIFWTRITDINTSYKYSVVNDPAPIQTNYANYISVSPHRIAWINESGIAFFSEDSSAKAIFCIPSAQKITQVAISDSKIGFLTQDHMFFMNRGDKNNAYELIAINVMKIALTDSRTGYIDLSGNCYVIDDAHPDIHILEDVQVRDIALSPTRIGCLETDGDFYVKEGDLRSGWILENKDMSSIAVTDTMIGCISSSETKRFFLKCGDLRSGWILENENVNQISLTNNRIGCLRNDKLFYLKEGSPTGPWILEYDNAAAGVLSETRIGILDTNNIVWIKDGDARSYWTRQN